MYTLFQWRTNWTYILHSFTLCNKFNHMITWDVEEAYHMKCLTLLLNKGMTGCSCITSVDGMVIDQLTWYNSLWLWRWLPHRLSKRQSLSTTTVLFRTTFTQTIKLNLLLNSSSVLWIFQKSHLPVEQVMLRTEFTSPIAKCISPGPLDTTFFAWHLKTSRGFNAEVWGKSGQLIWAK